MGCWYGYAVQGHPIETRIYLLNSCYPSNWMAETIPKHRGSWPCELGQVMETGPNKMLKTYQQRPVFLERNIHKLPFLHCPKSEGWVMGEV